MPKKTPIWIMSEHAQLCRILRYSEAKEIIENIDIEYKPGERYTSVVPAEVSRSTVQIWLQTLLFTGMRLYEVHKLHQNPTYGNPPVSRFQDDGTILLDKNLFYDTGKKRQTARERVVYLSDMGMKIVPRFFEKELIHKDPFRTANILDSVLTYTSEKLGYEKRTYTATRNRYNPANPDEPIKENYQKTRTGVMVRSFRKTWNSWLVNAYKDQPSMWITIEKSMGHTMGTAMEHYLTAQYDDEDMEDIYKATKGFGLHPGWRLTNEINEEPQKNSE